MNNKELEKYFGKMIRSKRRELKITQEQLAELVGISTTYLRSVEQGNHSIAWGTWLNICLALQININDFVDKVRINYNYLR